MKSNLTEIVFILDKSGSMSSMGNEPVDGYNKFIDEQRDPSLGEANVTFVLFDDEVETVYNGVKISEVEKLSMERYIGTGMGMTSLYDTIGKTFTEVGKRLSNTPESERASKVIVCILTDGQENSSKEFTLSTIKNMIKEQTEKYSWKIQFMGTTLGAIESAKNIGLAPDSFELFDNNSDGLRQAYRSHSLNASSYRTSVM